MCKNSLALSGRNRFAQLLTQLHITHEAEHRFRTNLNRIKTRTYSGEAAGQQTPTVYFTYDGVYYRPDGYKLSAAGNAKDALTQIRNGISTAQTIAFDALGRAEIYQ